MMSAGVVTVYNGALAIIRFRVDWANGGTPWTDWYTYSESHSFTLSQYGAPDGGDVTPHVEVKGGPSKYADPVVNDDSNNVAYYSVYGSSADIHITPPGPPPANPAARDAV